ncbi:MAG: MATE family efflux transporter [Mogibacterium sp.]|nr:MATE family efflux transporter [Mogibacterium sp.]
MFLDPKPLPKNQPFTDKRLAAMIIPLMIEHLLQMIVGIADTMMVSYAGEATVSGVSLDTMIYTIFIYLFTALGTGGAVVVSHYIGHGEKKNSDRAASQIYFIAGVISLIAMVFMLIVGRGLLGIMYPTVEPEVMQACRTYLWIVTLSFPANALYNAGAALYRSMGRTRTTMFVSLGMNILNVAGNAIGIFVLHAGAAGVAWPTTISWYFAAIVMTALCTRKQSEVTLTIGDALRPDRQMVSRISRIAAPNAVENTLFQLARVLLGTLTATFGTAHIAANGIGQTIWSLSASMCVVMVPITTTVIGQCMGAGDIEATEWYMKKIVRLSMLLSTFWNFFILALVPLILPLYSVSAETKHLLWIVVIIHNVFASFAQPFSHPLSAGIRATGDAKFTMWAAIFSTIVCRTLLSFILGLWMKLGVIGIAIAMGLDWCIKGSICVVRWKSGKWKSFKVI